MIVVERINSTQYVQTLGLFINIDKVMLKNINL